MTRDEFKKIVSAFFSIAGSSDADIFEEVQKMFKNGKRDLILLLRTK